ncbi:hypothetical protein LGQ02_19095 [Bacillus shivajii]|uniref:hypothetical protein n=1 Tax=Bacillus shivajii TaxID=1983719 RepID=UPI001CFA4A99|nr:hypothetical protein [Bacillus shivajii]UCZ52863.1 hypothetical protein LGQ02_19095 [Bacillus shivajii]
MFLSNFTMTVSTEKHVEENDRVVLIKDENQQIKVYHLKGYYITTLNEEVSSMLADESTKYECYITDVQYRTETVFHRKDEFYEDYPYLSIKLHFIKEATPYFLNQKINVIDGQYLDTKDISEQLQNQSNIPTIVKMKVPMTSIRFSAYQPMILSRSNNRFALKNTKNAKDNVFTPIYHHLFDSLFPFDGEYENVVYIGGYELVRDRNPQDILKEKNDVKRKFGIDDSDPSLSMMYKKKSSKYLQALDAVKTKYYYTEIVLSNISLHKAAEKVNLCVPPQREDWRELRVRDWEIQETKPDTHENNGVKPYPKVSSELGMLMDLGQQEHERKIATGEYETYDPTYDSKSVSYMEDDDRYLQRVRDGEE